MPKRTGHYLKPGVRASAPGVLFSVVAMPSITTIGGDESHQWASWGGAAVAVSRFKRDRWAAPDVEWFDIAADLHKWMGERADPTRRNYVVTPDGQETAANVGLWAGMDGERVTYIPQDRIRAAPKKGERGKWDTIIRRVVLSPQTFVLDMLRHEVRWVWLSARQFFADSEDELAKIVPGGWTDTRTHDTPGSHTVHAPQARARLWLSLFQRLSDWWLKHAKAPFGLTASALSLGILRTHVKPKALCSHTQADVLPMERAACFGGMARTWYYGDIGMRRTGAPPIPDAPAPSGYGTISGPMHHVDVRSMYPWLLRERSYPTHLIGYREDVPARDVIDLARFEGVVARVTIETDRAEYPERVSDRIYYRTGRFTTTLTGPELVALAEDGRIVKCHALATYNLGRPFRDAASAMIRMREQARGPDAAAWALFAKRMANGLGGKLAQRRGNWEHTPTVAPLVSWGEWYDYKRGGRSMTRYRSIAGIVWEWRPDPSGSGPYTAAFAYLAAYGRLHMRGIRDACPVQTVLSMDTDGLWVRPAALCALERSGCLRPEGAGALRLSDTSVVGRFFGPRHYWSAGGWVLAGFARPAVSAHGAQVTDTTRFTAPGSRGGGAPQGTAVRTRVSRLRVESHGMRIGADGWATPAARPH